MKKIIVIVSLLALCVIWYEARISSHSSNTNDVSFMVTQGESTSQIATNLQKEKLISSTLAFKIYLYLHHSSLIQAGNYSIEARTSTRNIIVQLTKGIVADREVNVLIREGLNVKEINDYLKQSGFLHDDSFLTEAKHYEGYLFPDTYRMFKNFTAADLITKMRNNFEKKLSSELRTAMQQSGHKAEDIIIMASIVEKEARTEADMKIVSGIFWDRIANGQPLESDVTLAYTQGKKDQYSFLDTRIDSPYNTYLHRGLPRGPVSNPGLTAIMAAIYPTKTDYNYFLSRPDTGEMIYSKTLAEHNAAKQKYLK